MLILSEKYVTTYNSISYGKKKDDGLTMPYKGQVLWDDGIYNRIDITNAVERYFGQSRADNSQTQLELPFDETRKPSYDPKPMQSVYLYCIRRDNLFYGGEVDGIAFWSCESTDAVDYPSYADANKFVDARLKNWQDEFKDAFITIVPSQ